MKHRGGSGVDFTNLVLILHLSLILMGLSANPKKTIQVSHMTIVLVRLGPLRVKVLYP